MRKLQVPLACLAALTLIVSACGGDDSGSDSTTATTTAAATTVPSTGAATTVPSSTATTAGSGSTTPGTAAPTTTAAPETGSKALTSAEIAEKCKAEPLEATEVGVSASEITIEVMADTGSPLAPGLFQGNVDAIKGFADYINDTGGIGCRKLVVRTWDSKLDPTESKNGLIDSCANAVSMVGNNSLFNPDITPMTSCVDKAGAATGLPNMAALATDATEMCGATTFTIQFRAESCPVTVGQPRDFNVLVGAMKQLEAVTPNLKGLFLVPGDLPTTRQSAVPNIAGQTQAGVTFDGTPLVSGRDEQAAFTQRVQTIKNNDDNYVYNGSNDLAMVKMQKEAAAQGLDTKSIVWTCSLACYTKNMLSQGGETSEGTHVWMQFLPFEEADTNAALKSYVDTVGEDKADSFGAQAWQAGIAFQQVVNQIVFDDGPNAITRAALLDGFTNLKDFTADGWAGAKGLREISPCYVMVTIQDGKFVREWPKEPGTLDCSPDNLTKVTVEPVSAAEALG